MRGRDYLLTGTLLLVITVIASAFAFNGTVRESGQMKLLAVSEHRNGTLQGNVADLFVELRPGTGRVFIDTFPVTKLDTQLSTRFGKEIACSFAGVDCFNLDFFYTIRSRSPTIGGPSAGAAITVMTVALLENLDIDGSVLITGTINSGGVIGPVGGLKQKIDAASELNATKILVSRGSLLVSQNDTNGTNESIDLQEYAAERGIELIEVGELREAVYEVTGKWYKPLETEVSVDEMYQTTMHGIAVDLCNRSEKLSSMVLAKNTSSYLAGLNLSEQGDLEFSRRNYYAAASRCFGSNIRFKQAWYDEQDYSRVGFESEYETVEIFRDRIRSKLDDLELGTVTDLQTFIIVDERVLDSELMLQRSIEELEKNDTELASYYLAYSYERLNSAVSWSKFFGRPGKELRLDNDVLGQSCLRKLSEAEERLQYVYSFYPVEMAETRKELENAYEDYAEENFELCLFRASKAKAELDVIMSVSGVSEEKLTDLLQQKLAIAGNAIVEETAKGNFPILGYSYYEYSGALASQDKYSALIYAEYALELSNLDLYLNNVHEGKRRIRIDYGILWLFVGGVLFGVLIGALIRHSDKAPPKRR